MNARPATGSGGGFRDRVHDLMRTSILDAAWTRAIEVPWSQVRIADVAEDVGISRQTIYNEFGTKDQLGEAIFTREMNTFLDRMEEQFNSQERFSGAVRSALDWMLDETLGHALLTRITADAKGGSDEGLIAILTFRSEKVIGAVRSRLTEMVSARWPAVDRASTEVVADLMVRFVLGQVVTPTDLDRSAVVDAMVTMAMHVDVTAGGAASEGWGQ